MPYITFGMCLLFVLLHLCIPGSVKPHLLTSPAELLSFHSWLAIPKALLASFLHANWGHLLGNTSLFFIFGVPLEKTVGKKHYICLLLATALGALMLHVGSDVESTQKFLGASGYVLGLLAAFIIML